ncbi:hypothetical protein MPSEU_000844400 [Mayamaea pseudoterrestris]|nr:hypothetical protein MPSEU_000844400 [Mayamaea pseudoterrestris]
MFRLSLLSLCCLLLCSAFQPLSRTSTRASSNLLEASHDKQDKLLQRFACHEQLASNSQSAVANRRNFFLSTTAAVLSVATTSAGSPTQANAVGPIKIAMKPTSYTAQPCPPNKPIPGQQAMKGMRGLCVTVNADLLEAPPKNMDKAGVYGFVLDGASGDSVLANNPDLNTDAGQFAMIELIKSTDKKIQFEFIAAVPKERDLTQYDNGIGPLSFESLRVISYPGGQQFGEINPCEMNEFSDECEAWETENGPYERGDFMVKSRSNKKGD